MANSAFGPVLGPVAHVPVNSRTPHTAPDDQALGLRAIYNACRALYPDQPTPLQVTAVRKYWMGGPDPLDFINMYANPGSRDCDSPPHWHYITNGLSDLYGDSRLHNQCASADDPSGFGFELTLRIRREASDGNPPTWPAHLLQSLARYVFHSQAQLMVGDHIPWPSALDEQPVRDDGERPPQAPSNQGNGENANAHSIAMAAAATAASILTGSKGFDLQTANPSTYASMFAAALAAVNRTTADSNKPPASESTGTAAHGPKSTSRIHHMLVVEDPQLKRTSTPYGYVQFLQLVGLCDEELRLVQRWTGNDVMHLMNRLPETGGGLLVTDMRRKSNLFELEPKLSDYVEEHLRREGSNLSGVTTQFFAWAPISLTILTELLPGEAEAQHSRNLSQRLDHDSPMVYNTTSLSKETTMGSESNLPTDLRVHHTAEEVGPVAMETDETVVSSSTTKKDPDDDDFVDVVGDSGPSSACNQSNRVDSKDDTIHVAGVGDLPVMPVSAISNQTTEKTAPNESVSAPGGFSAWCARLVADKKSVADDSRANGSLKPTSGRTVNLTNELTCPTSGPLGFRTFNTDQAFNVSASTSYRPAETKGTHTPGSAGEGSAPCTPLAHLSLSPASLDILPTRVVDCLDIQLCREAGEMLPLAVNDRLRHGKHFTLLNAHFPDHAITLVPEGVSGAFVSEQTPYVARGPWLQVLLPKDFLERLEFQFSILTYPDELMLPLIFRWPERRLRICIVDPTPRKAATSLHGASFTTSSNQCPLLPKAVAVNTSDHLQELRKLSASTEKPQLTKSCSVLSESPRTGAAIAAATLAPKPSSTSDGFTLPPHSFPYFPPGCVPPPAMLAAVFNSQFPASRYNQAPASNAAAAAAAATLTSTGPLAIRGDENAMSYWMRVLSNCSENRDPTSVASNPMLNIPELMQSALATMQLQQHGSGTSPYPSTRPSNTAASSNPPIHPH